MSGTLRDFARAAHSHAREPSPTARSLKQVNVYLMLTPVLRPPWSSRRSPHFPRDDE